MPQLAYSIINDADHSAPVLILAPSLGTLGSLPVGVGYRHIDCCRALAQPDVSGLFGAHRK